MGYDVKLGSRVVMGLPTTHMALRTPVWIDSMAGLQMPLGSSLARKWIIDEPIAAARNALCQSAIDMGAEYLFMLGDDVIPPPNTILALLEKIGRTYTSRDGTDQRASMITGIYWTKTYPPEPYIFRTDPVKGLLGGTFRDWKAGEFIDVDIAGCDCLLIETEMLKNIPFPWFSTDWIWEPGQKVSSIATEDYYFYTKARDHGYRLFADTGLQCLHEDRNTGAVFGLSMDMVQANAIPDVGLNEVLVAELGAGFSSENQGLYGPKAKIVRFDMRPETNPDVVCDIRHLDEHWLGKFDWVNASHVIEHFRRSEAVAILAEWVKLLKVGGTLTIHVPNIENALRNILNPPIDATPELKAYWWAQVYGDQAKPGAPWQHLNGFTPRKLENLLKTVPELGDIVVVEETEGFNLKGTARLKSGSTPYTLTTVWNKIYKREGALGEAPTPVTPAPVPTPAPDMQAFATLTNGVGLGVAAHGGDLANT